MKFLLLIALVVSVVGIAVGSTTGTGDIGEIDDTEIVLSGMPLVAAAGMQ